MKINDNDWSKIGIGVVLIILAIGLIMYFMKVDLWIDIAFVVFAIGIYLFFSSFLKNEDIDQFGTSLRGTSIALSFLCFALGGAFLGYKLSENLIVAVAVFLIVVGIWVILSIFVDRKKEE